MAITLKVVVSPSAVGTARIGTTSSPTATSITVDSYSWVYIQTDINSSYASSYTFSKWVFVPEGQTSGNVVSSSKYAYVQAGAQSGTYYAFYNLGATVTWYVYTIENYVGAPVLANECIEGVGCTALVDTGVVKTTVASQTTPVTIYQTLFKYSDCHIVDFSVNLGKSVITSTDQVARIYQIGNKSSSISIPGFKYISAFPNYAGDSPSSSYGGYKPFIINTNIGYFDSSRSGNNPLYLRVRDVNLDKLYGVDCYVSSTTGQVINSNVPLYKGHTYRFLMSSWFESDYKVDWIGITKYKLYSDTTYTTISEIEYYKIYTIDSNTEESFELTYGTDTGYDIYISMSYAGSVYIYLSSDTEAANVVFSTKTRRPTATLPANIGSSWYPAIKSYDTDNYVFGYWTYNGETISGNTTTAYVPYTGAINSVNYLVAHFFSLTKNIYFNKIGDGTGSVSMAVPGQEVVTEEGISKPAKVGYSVTFTAEASRDSVFVGWYKGGSKISSDTTFNYTVQQDDYDDLQILASFRLKTAYTFNLIWETETGVHAGTVTVNDTTVSIPYTTTLYEGDYVILRYYIDRTVFVGWVNKTGGIVADNPYGFYIDDTNTDIKISYTWWQDFTIKAKTNDFEGGYAVVAFNGQSDTQKSQDDFAELKWTDPNTEFKVQTVVPTDTAAHRFAYSFQSWEIVNTTTKKSFTSETNPYVFNTIEMFTGSYTMTADIKRKFTIECYAVPQTEGDGYIVIGSAHYHTFDFYYGETCTIHAEPLEGYEFDHWSVESLDPTYLDVTQADLTFIVNEHTANAIGSNAFYIAKFKEIPKTAIVKAEWNSDIPHTPLSYNTDGSEVYTTWTGDIEINIGTTVYLKALLWVGNTWEFQHWETGYKGTTTSITPTEDYTIVLTYKDTVSPQLIIMFGLLLIASGDTEIHPDKVATKILQIGKFLL